MFKKLILIALPTLVCHSMNIYAQGDSLICYDYKTKITDTIPPPIFDEAIEFDHTSWNLGQDNNVVALDTLKPLQTMLGSGFTDIKAAQSFYNVNHYPIRTAVKIIRYHNGAPAELGDVTGILISPTHVLTCAHCVLYYYEDVFYDSLIIAPAYDNGAINSEFSFSTAKKSYIVDSDDDICMIEVNEPIGLQTGWIGIAFCADLEYFNNKIFHTFSYPSQATSNRAFNGDTLYYKYGTLDYIRTGDLGYYGDGYGGESGSSMLYTNNESYYSFGTLNSCLYNSRLNTNITLYTRINNEIFYAFKDIIDKSIETSIEKARSIPDKFMLMQNYPNPFNPVTHIEYNMAESGFVDLSVYNTLGQKVNTLVHDYKPKGIHCIKWQPVDLTSGIYFYQLKVAGHKSSFKSNMVIIKKMILQK